MSYPQMANDVLETLDALNLANVSVLGHSMGGKVAMQLALQAPQRVKKLILADISPVVNEPRHLGILQALQNINLTTLKDRREADQQLSTSVKELGVRQFLLKNLVKENDKFKWRLNLSALVANYPAILAAPEAKGPYVGPVLFIKGGDSDYLLPSHQSQIQQLFPHAKAKVIQGTGHWLHAEKPAAFSKIVTDFLLS
jgi:esterase